MTHSTKTVCLSAAERNELIRAVVEHVQLVEHKAKFAATPERKQECTLRYQRSLWLLELLSGPNDTAADVDVHVSAKFISSYPRPDLRPIYRN